jgi:hypothetical protein
MSAFGSGGGLPCGAASDVAVPWTARSTAPSSTAAGTGASSCTPVGAAVATARSSRSSLSQYTSSPGNGPLAGPAHAGAGAPSFRMSGAASAEPGSAGVQRKSRRSPRPVVMPAKDSGTLRPADQASGGSGAVRTRTVPPAATGCSSAATSRARLLCG